MAIRAKLHAQPPQSNSVLPIYSNELCYLHCPSSWTEWMFGLIRQLAILKWLRNCESPSKFHKLGNPTLSMNNCSTFISKEISHISTRGLAALKLSMFSLKQNGQREQSAADSCFNLISPHNLLLNLCHKTSDILWKMDFTYKWIWICKIIYRIIMINNCRLQLFKTAMGIGSRDRDCRGGLE